MNCFQIFLKLFSISFLLCCLVFINFQKLVSFLPILYNKRLVCQLKFYTWNFQGYVTWNPLHDIITLISTIILKWWKYFKHSSSKKLVNKKIGTKYKVLHLSYIEAHGKKKIKDEFKLHPNLCYSNEIFLLTSELLVVINEFWCRQCALQFQ